MQKKAIPGALIGNWLVAIAIMLLIPLNAVAFPDGSVKASSKPQPVAALNGYRTKMARLRIPFIANEGQVSAKHVKYYATTFSGTLYVTERGEMVYALPHRRADKEMPAGWVLKESLIGNAAVTLQALDPSSTRVNYFVGDRTRWRSNIATYNELSLGQVYVGIGLKLRAYGKNVEKIFTVHPGKAPETIRIKMEGALGLDVNMAGELVVHTGLGPVTFSKPVAFQEIDGLRRPVPVAYRIQEKGYGFAVGAYDKNAPLIIDPLIGSTFLGGSSSDFLAGTNSSDPDIGKGLVVADDGSIYVTGYTYSTDFPATPPEGYLNADPSGTNADAFVCKFNSTLTSLDVSTYLGGTSNDYAYGIALDPAGAVYVTGKTGGSFPIAGTTVQTTYGGGSADVFVAKLTSNLSDLSTSTYLGHTQEDVGNALTVFNNSGTYYVYVTGFTKSQSFPTPINGAFDKIHEGDGNMDVFISKLSSDLVTLNRTTFLGDSGVEQGAAIAVDATGNVYVTGQTTSTSPWSQIDADHQGNQDVFVSKLDADLLTHAGKFFGGDGDDAAYAIGLDGSSNVYITGYTHDEAVNDFPATLGAHQETHSGGTQKDAFVAILDSALNGIDYATFLGGTGDDWGRGITRDTSGNVLITGYTKSSDYDFTTGAYLTSNPDPACEHAVISKLNSTLSDLSYSTYMGGGCSTGDKGKAIAMNGDGYIVIAGDTGSVNYPTTSGAAYENHVGGGSTDVFVTILNPTAESTSPTVDSTSPTDGATNVAVNTSITATFSTAMDSSTITTSTFTVTKEAGPAVSGTVSYSGVTATFTPAADLSADTTYRATLDTGVKDTDGTALAADYTWIFKTGEVIPTVISTSPFDGATDVAVNSTITAAFSTSMDGTTITTSTFTVTDASGPTVSGTVSYSGVTATFTPAADLSSDTTYTATLTTGVKDTNGEALADDYTWSFTTVALIPTVSATSPSDGETNVAVNSDITATFSHVMDGNTITTSTFTVAESIGTAVDGSVTYNPMAIFDPTQDLSSDTTYTATITTGAKSATGVALASDYSWSFSTDAGFAPNTPSGTIPADLTQMTGTSVTLEGSAFDDPDAGDTHAESQVRVRMAGQSYGKSSYPVSFTQTATSGSLTTFTVDGLINGMKYFWQIRYMDAGGTWSEWSVEISFIVGTSIPDNSVVIGAGSSAFDFQMVSFAQFPDDPSIANVLGLGTPLDTTSFRIGTYDPLSGSYVEYGDGLAIEPGRGYWFLCRDGLSITVNGVPVTSSQAVEVEMKYNSTLGGEGWNMIGPPNSADYSWSDVQIVVYDASGNIVFGPATIGSLASGNPYINVLLYRYSNDGLYYSDTTRVEQYQGYWAEVKQGNVYLRFESGAQVARGASGLKVMLADLFDGVQRWSRKWILATPVAMANGSGPPAPPGGFYVCLAWRTGRASGESWKS